MRRSLAAIFAVGLLSYAAAQTYPGGGGVPAASPTFTGVATFAPGTTAIPSVVSSNSPTTGISWPAVGQFAISSAGTVRLDYGVTNVGGWTMVTAGDALRVTGAIFVTSGVQVGSSYSYSNGTALNSTGSGIFVFQNNGNTQNFTVNTSATAGLAGFGGAIAATLASAVGTNAVCNTPGTTTALTVQVWATGCAASSARFKDAITAIDREKAFETVLALQPVSYFYKPEFNMGDDRHIGFTAEQVGSVDPSLITFEDDGVTPHAVKYNEMAPLFAAAIQQLKADNDNLRADIEALKAAR